MIGHSQQAAETDRKLKEKELKALLAARFFRAFDYFLLVQTFGGVPLDLGSGELKFNITPSRTSCLLYTSLQ